MDIVNRRARARAIEKGVGTPKSVKAARECPRYIVALGLVRCMVVRSQPSSWGPVHNRPGQSAPGGPDQEGRSGDAAFDRPRQFVGRTPCRHRGHDERAREPIIVVRNGPTGVSWVDVTTSVAKAPGRFAPTTGETRVCPHPARPSRG